ncbi:MAG: pyruvate kinase [Candidatus Kapaibacterium sp.]
MLRTLRDEVRLKGEKTMEQWAQWIERETFRSSALNLAHYLALREHDLRPVQTLLMPWGLSSLGRSEGRVLPNLDAVIATLEVLCGAERTVAHPPLDAFFLGEHQLEQNAANLFGQQQSGRRIRIMVTMPPEAAQNPQLLHDLLDAGMDCMRINCAHELSEEWTAMVSNLRLAEQELKRSCKILMDIAGPRVRTGMVITPLPEARLYPGDSILLSRADKLQHREDYRFQASCTLPEIFDKLTVGTELWIDEGKVSTTVTKVLPEGFELKVLNAGLKGVKLKSGKGINLPKTKLSLNPLIQKDYEDLDFIVKHADLVGYSFVQEVGDIKLLQNAIKERAGDRAFEIGIIAKIETQRAVRNLPELIVASAGKQPFGVMIARGDLAVEIGYQRLAEIQEEILWLCEAAQIPVVWATQVLENLVSTGTPSRAEMTDAAMAERSECVMLNKGPFVVQAVAILDDVLRRMQEHQLKKTPQLRELHVWQHSEKVLQKPATIPSEPVEA